LNSEFDRIESIIKDLLVFSKPSKEQYIDCNVIDLIKQTVYLMEPQATLKNVQISTQFDNDTINIRCIPHQIQQVVMNLIKNGIEAIEMSGVIAITVQSQHDYVILIVRDSGKGMSHSELEKLGTPFHSTKDSGNGLGIMMTENIIKNNHHGTITVQSTINQGTIFKIELPISMDINPTS
jgi:signal transduction histidine kinase